MDSPLLSAAQLAQHLRSLRRARGLSQARLGELLGLSQSRVARIENSPGQISVDALLQVLAALDAQLLLRDKAAGAQPWPAQVSPSHQVSDVKGDW
ncbi:MAG: helix-turn-helix domain-containing protein [Rubrivivax sp.]|nr:MAG: helix-turn-helix domain-containing protein [Rubrivivax sp.]